MPTRSRLTQHAIPEDRDLAELLPNFETDNTCRGTDERLANALQKHSKSGQKIARSLLKCASKNDGPCGSGACRRCLRQARRLFFASASRIVDHFRAVDGSYGIIASVVPAGLQAAPGKLDQLDLSEIASAMWRAIHRMALSYPILAGIDVSYNEDACRIVAAHWQVHLNLAVLGAPLPAAQAQVREAIQAAFSLEPTALRPVYVQPLEDLPSQLSYLLKSSFARRVSVIDWRGKRNSVSRPLKTREQVELAYWLNRFPPSIRLIVSGVRRRGFLLTHYSLRWARLK